MPRPIRDIPPNIAAVGDASRAYGRVDRGADWLARGNAAVKRGLDSLADLAAQRLQRVRELEDEVALQRADADFRLRLGEAVRNLDPAADDYLQQVADAFNSVLEAARQDNAFPGNRVAERFAARAESIRTSTLLQAADNRERAVVALARQSAQEEINRAAAAVASGADYNAVIAAAMERLSGILARMDTLERQQIERNLRESVGTSYARALIGRRDFRGAEAALRDLGGQGVLTPTAVNALRAGLEQERRQAAGEARAEAAARFQMATIAIGMFSDEAQQMTPEEAREQAARMQPQIDAAIAAVGGPNSPRGMALARSWERAVARASNRYILEFNAIASRLEMGEELSPRDQRRFVEIQGIHAAQSAEVPPNATPEQARRLRAAAAEEARWRTALYLAARQNRQAVQILADEAAQANSPEQVARLVDAIRFIAQSNPGMGEANPTIRAIFAANPALESAYRQAQSLGIPLTGTNVAGLYSVLPRIDADAAERLERNFDRTYPLSGNAIEVAATRSAINSALRAAGISSPDEGVRMNVLSRAREIARRAGVAPDVALRQAAEGYARSTVPQVMFASPGWTGQPPRLPAEQSPLTYVPPNIRDQFGPESISGAAREALEAAGRSALRSRGLPDNMPFAVLPHVHQQNGRPMMTLSVRLENGASINIFDAETGLIRMFDLSDESTWRDFFRLTDERRAELERRYRNNPTRRGVLRRTPIYDWSDVDSAEE